MTYQVLARKWRPQDFSSLVGQEPIVTALRNALIEGRIAQAYLFSGIRGVGKTTAARVFAKALNCRRSPGSKERPEADPCNDCLPCREITTGADIDVLEIDAATYSKVEQVRELTESLRYGAARDRFKVVVLDEVHRLSRQAFDALLKIVEEPPAHLVFIFATTEIDAVPATILSRCQEFQFRRVSAPVLAAHLRRIADAESIEVSDAALRMMARAGEGSVRDAVALLDQLATFGGGEISDQDANRLLGGLDAEIFRRLLAGILTAEHAAITAVVREIEENGWDPNHVYSQFLGYVRDALHLALAGKPESLDLPLEEATSLLQVVQDSTYGSLLQLAQLLLAGELTVRRSEFGLLALEITWLRAAELPTVTRVEDLLSGRAPAKVPKDLKSIASAPPPAPRQVTAAPETTDRSRETAPETDLPHEPGIGADGIPRFKELLSGRRQSLAAHVNNAEHLEFNDGALIICPRSGDALLEKALTRPANAEVLAQAVREIWGEGARYEVRPGAPAASPGKAGPTPEPPRTKVGTSASSSARRSSNQEKIRKHPAVKAVLDIFPGKIRSIDPRSSQSGELKK